MEKMNQRRKAQPRNNIRKYRRFRFVDPGVIVFFFLACYLVVCVAMYLMKPHINTYEVSDGSIVSDYSYTGIAIRTEQPVMAQTAGYITYYARELEKVGALTSVYSLDETGQLAELLSDENISATSLSDENLIEMNKNVNDFYEAYTDMNFSESYQFKQEIEGMTVQLIQQTLIENASKINGSTAFHVCNSPLDGIVSYRIDGYEGITKESVTKETLEASKEYSYEDLTEQNIVDTNSVAYKVITEDEWTIVISTDENTAERLLEEDYVQLHFKKDKTKVWGQVSTWKNGEDTMVGFTFTNSMIRFANERFIDFSFELEDVKGLKVPKSSVAQRELYAIPMDYLEVNSAGDLCNVYYEKYDTEGNASVSLLELDIAYEKEEEGFVYINTDEILQDGSVIVKPASGERYTIAKTEVLTGVYNYNKGYAVFCPVNILHEADEYCIIESQTKYGLAKYDYIVLESAAIEDAVAIYQ